MRPSKFAKAMLMLAALLFFCMFASCDITKQAAKSKTETDFSENITTKTTRPGDTVRIKVPKITYKDTVIYTYSRQGTTLQTVYDKNGTVTDIACISASVDELKTEIRNLTESRKEKESIKTESFNADFILYIILGAVLIVVVLVIGAVVYLKSSR